MGWLTVLNMQDRFVNGDVVLPCELLHHEEISCVQGSGVGMVSMQAAPARVRRGWGSWVRRWLGGGVPDAALAAFPLACALTSSAAAALPGTGEKYAALLESGACDERTLLMLLLVRTEALADSLALWT